MILIEGGIFPPFLFLVIDGFSFFYLYGRKPN